MLLFFIHLVAEYQNFLLLCIAHLVMIFFFKLTHFSGPLCVMYFLVKCLVENYNRDLKRKKYELLLKISIEQFNKNNYKSYKITKAYKITKVYNHPRREKYNFVKFSYRIREPGRLTSGGAYFSKRPDIFIKFIEIHYPNVFSVPSIICEILAKWKQSSLYVLKEKNIVILILKKYIDSEIQKGVKKNINRVNKISNFRNNHEWERILPLEDKISKDLKIPIYL